MITTYGRDLAVASTLFHRPTMQGKVGRQMQTWVRFPDGWHVVAAGKIAVPKEIINKPGALTDEEWVVIKTHTVEGERMLARVGGVLGEVGSIVRSSHERWDGSGYPDGLAGDEIPLESCIVSCCDAFDAMTTDRSYRTAMPLERALTELAAGAGTQFHPRVAAVLAELVSPQAQAASRSVAAPAPSPVPRAAPATPR